MLMIVSVSNAKPDFSKVESLLLSKIDQHVFPGCAAAVMQNGELLFAKAFGNFTYGKRPAPVNGYNPKVNLDTLWDLINVQDPVAVRYNDKLVLENHHVASAFALLIRDSNGHMLDHLSKEEYFKFRQTVIELVLITDLAHYVQFVEEYRGMIAENEPTGSEEREGSSRTWSSGSIGRMKQSFGYDDASECKHASLEFVMKCPKCYSFASSLNTLGKTVHSGLRSREDQLLVWKLLLKAADVGHAAKPMSLHLKWSQRIVEEMFRQGDVEKTLGMSVSPLMNRNKIDSLSTSQVGFIDFICMPLFHSWDAIALASIAYTSISGRSGMNQLSIGQQKEFHELCLDALNVRCDDLFMAPMASRNRGLWENMGLSNSA